MYWPVGTPRIYATSSLASTSGSSPAASPNLNVQVSHDGLAPPGEVQEGRDRRPSSLLATESSSSQDANALPPTPITPATPFPPVTPGVKPVEHGYPFDSPDTPSRPKSASIPLHEPILALRVARAGHLFAVITATSMTIWQTKVACSSMLDLSPRLTYTSQQWYLH
jgi:hypothetical protein